MTSAANAATVPDARPAADRPDADLYAGNHEPTLNEVLNDPIVRRRMASDGVAVVSVEAVIREARRRLAASA
ncbi:hypothetical protein [Roseospirillum parvum]|uniref:Uncharacterized protein n=1 Tax=Roseospirillum parvum TaxID=83401 RepID=A0A1G7VZG7_9PROT|nr:hypothetical protein [Roseospirillum parvum]SDG65155.1 hypothetical protein SAMN05421742_10225 [Roseospirillum parvum]